MYYQNLIKIYINNIKEEQIFYMHTGRGNFLFEYYIIELKSQKMEFKNIKIREFLPRIHVRKARKLKKEVAELESQQR